MELEEMSVFGPVTISSNRSAVGVKTGNLNINGGYYKAIDGSAITYGRRI